MSTRRAYHDTYKHVTNFLHAVHAHVALTTPLRNVACEHKAVTAEIRAIGLQPDGKPMLLNWVSASRELRLLKQFRQEHCPMIDQNLNSCDSVGPALRAKVRVEVHQHIANLPWLQVGQQGAITSVRKDVIYVTLDALAAPLQVTTVLTAAATLIVIYNKSNINHRPPPSTATATHRTCQGIS